MQQLRHGYGIYTLGSHSLMFQVLILNDPGRLIGSHLMHTAQISGWIGSMLLYEVLITDRTDTVFNPVWRQGCYAMPIAVRLGSVSSVYGWNLGISQVGSVWSYESIIISHRRN